MNKFIFIYFLYSKAHRIIGVLGFWGFGVLGFWGFNCLQRNSIAASGLLLRVFFRKSILFWLLLWSGVALGQIVDDSTKLVYGPATTKYYTEDDIKNNIDKRYDIDTVLHKFENFSYYDQFDRFYQDLGNNGTAMAPIFYQIPQTIGKTSGFHAYDLYYKFPNQFRYFDTKSPYMEVGAVFAGQGRSNVDFTFTQNVNPKWNVGIDLSRVTSDKQIGAEQNEGDVNARNIVYDIFSYYQHDTAPYKLILNYTGFSHNIDETGGVLVLTEDPLDFEFFQYRDSRIQLQDAVSTMNYNNFHVYQEYGFFKQFQLYHQLDRFKQENRYEDSKESNPSSDFNTYTDY